MSNKCVLNACHVGEPFTVELPQSKIKVTMPATFEEIKVKTENCGRELETNKEPNGNSRSEKQNK